MKALCTDDVPDSLRYRHYPIKEIREFNPMLKTGQQAFVYGITGGIPYYINKLAVEDDVDEALKDNLFNTSSYLFEEPENLLKQEEKIPVIPYFYTRSPILPLL